MQEMLGLRWTFRDNDALKSISTKPTDVSVFQSS